MAEEKTTHKLLHNLVPEETREHLQAAREELRKGYEAMFPPGFLEHRRAAKRELLLAARSFLDAALKRMDEK